MHVLGRNCGEKYYCWEAGGLEVAGLVQTVFVICHK